MTTSSHYWNGKWGLVYAGGEGPGLGGVGPAMNFGDLPGAAKFALSICMVLGRLEFYALVALLMPTFWHR